MYFVQLPILRAWNFDILLKKISLTFSYVIVPKKGIFFSYIILKKFQEKNWQFRIHSTKQLLVQISESFCEINFVEIN